MRELSAKRRLLSVLNRESVDRPPFVCPGGMMNMAVTDVMDAVDTAWPRAHSDAEAMARLVHGVHELGGVENFGTPFCMTIEAEGMGAAVDLGDRQTEPRVVTYAIDHLDEIDRLTPFDPGSGRAVVATAATEMLARAHPDVATIANLTGPISLATSLIEPLTFYRAMRKDPAAAHRLLELSTESAMAFGDALVAAGADVICIADPSATGDLIGKNAFAEFGLGYLNEIADHFTARGVPSVVHICGDVRPLADVLPRLSADALSVDSIVPMPILRELAPNHLTMGNVSTYVLAYGTPKTLAAVARNRVRVGVDIVAPACGIGSRTPLENLRAVAMAVVGDETHEESAA